MKKSLSIMLVLLMAVMVIVGCQPARRPNPANPNQNQNETVPYNSDDGVVEGNIDVNDLNSRADRIAEAVNNIGGINRSHAIITDSTVLIGVELPESNARQLEPRLRDQIKGVVRDVDMEIDNIYITSDKNLTERIKRMADNIRQGFSITGMNEEMGKLMTDMRKNM